MVRPLLLLSFACCLLIPFEDAQAQSSKRPRRQPDKLKEGDKAPDFTLKTLSGKKEVTLSSFKGKKPVALVFGSYT